MTTFSRVEVQVVSSGDSEGELAFKPTEQLADRIDELTGSIQAIAENVRDRLSLSPPPNKHGWALDGISMEFKVELEAGAGVVVAKASTTGGFAITLNFSRP